MEKEENGNVVVWIIVVVLIVGMIGVVVLGKNSGKEKKASMAESEASQVSSTTQTMGTKALPDGLQITDEVVGTGTEAAAGDTVTVNYAGTLTDGNVFDASANHGNQGFTFVLGAGQVIKGWDEGILGMRVGGKRKLVIPPSLGYGNQDVGNGLIPPGSTLIFEVELLAVKP